MTTMRWWCRTARSWRPAGGRHGALQSSSQCPSTSPEVLFSEEHKRKTIDNLQKQSMSMSIRKSSNEKSADKGAAVLIPLCIKDGDVCLLYTKRSAGLRKHGREVSFPGGRADAGDTDAVETALRETEEEMGIARSDVDVWGSMKEISDSRGVRSVVPILGRLKKTFTPDDFKLNPAEVESVMFVPVHTLNYPEVKRYTQFRGRTEFPVGYTLPLYLTEPYPVWGMTAIVTYHFLQAFLPGYKHRLRYQSPMKH